MVKEAEETRGVALRDSPRGLAKRFARQHLRADTSLGSVYSIDKKKPIAEETHMTAGILSCPNSLA